MCVGNVCVCGWVCVSVPLSLPACPPTLPLREIYILFKAKRKRMSEGLDLKRWKEHILFRDQVRD